MDTERLTNEEKKMMSLFPDLTATFINDGLSGLSYTLRRRSPWTSIDTF